METAHDERIALELKARISALEAALADERRWNEKRKGVFDRIGVALEPYREKRWSGEPARNDADEVEALCAEVERLRSLLAEHGDHAAFCASGYGEGCNCWKRNALNKEEREEV